MFGAFPITGSTPERYRKAYYENPNNANQIAFQRRHSCVGVCVKIACDVNGDAAVGKICAECSKSGATWWCPQCKVFLHGLPQTKRTRTDGEGPLLMAAAAPAFSRKRDNDGNLINLYARMTCSDK